MPIAYSVDVKRGLILATWRGVITAADVEQHWKELLLNKPALAARKNLADLRGADIQFSGDDLRRLITGLVLPELQKGPWKSAIVVDHAVAYGISRQFQYWAEMFADSAIFKDEAAALEWLLAT